MPEAGRETEARASRGELAPIHEASDDAEREDQLEETSEHKKALNWRELTRILFVGAAAGAFWFAGPRPDTAMVLVGVICTVVGGYPIFHEAYENIAARRMTMELSMTIAILAALAIKEIFTALVITLFVLIAEVLEGLTVGRGRRAIQHLLDLLPSAATVRRDESWVEVSIGEVSAGDTVLVRPGGRIPVDGTVRGGHSFVDEATITGEAMPVEKRASAKVFAGTINQSGALEIRVEGLGRDTTFGKIVEAVERAERTKAPVQKLADRLAGYLVYFALGAAALTFVVTHNARSTISVVIVAGACGIAAGTPLAILGAIGRAAQQGSIIKGGLYLEKLAEIDTVLLDKTGTLTYGVPEVVEILPAAGIDERSVVEAAAIAESRSEHPLGRAILKKAAELQVAGADSEEFAYFPGKGVAGSFDGEEILVGSRQFLRERGIKFDGAQDGKASVCVARGGQFRGTILVADKLRPEAQEAMAELKRMGLQTVLLTGDSKRVAENVGAQLGVDKVAAELLPEQKLEYVQVLTAGSQATLMVGDGVNDAPALIEATVGIAMGSGTDVARESADVVLIGNDLSKLVETLRIARRCRRTIMQNFVGTLLVDGIGIGLAMFGVLSPVLAALIHVTSELAFILNSARLIQLPSGQAQARATAR